MPTGTEESFVANIKVDRVRRRQVHPNQHGRGLLDPETVREVETFKITLRAPTMEGLIEKLNKHLSLVDEHDFGTDAPTTRGS